MTSQYPAPDNRVLFASPAEAVSPMDWHPSQHWQTDPPAEYLGKVVLSDTDHIWGVGGTPDWVWRTFLRGHNILYMDTWGYGHFEVRGPDGDPATRRAMGRAVALSRNLDLGVMTPRPDLTSSGFALADPGERYIVYKPAGLRCRLDLRDAPGPFRVEWLHLTDETSVAGDAIQGGGVAGLTPPDDGPLIADVART